MHKVFLAMAASILGIIAVYFGINSLVVSSREFDNSYEESCLSEKPIVLFKDIHKNIFDAEYEESSIPQNYNFFVENSKSIKCKSFEDFNSVRGELNIAESGVLIDRCIYLGSEYIYSATAVYGDYDIEYSPKLAIKIVGFGNDFLITETEAYKYDFLRGVIPFGTYSAEISEKYREKQIDYFMAYTSDYGKDDLISAAENVRFPFHSEKIVDLEGLYSTYSVKKDEELKWRIKGELYRGIEESLKNGYHEIYFPSEIRTIRLIESVLDEMGKIPVSLVSDCFWSQS